MRPKLMLMVVLLWAALLSLVGCKKGDPPTSPGAGPIQVGATPPTPAMAGLTPRGTVHYQVEGEPLDDVLVVGKAAALGYLTVFPILAKSQPDVGPITSLDAALTAGTAEVRELGAGEGARPEPIQAQNAAPQVLSNSGSQQLNNAAPQIAMQGGASAEVGTLVIENKGSVPVFVLAGTVVKGGKQDRQIGQDFIIGPLATVPVDAFCVEHGRWSDQRQGAATGGKFSTLKQLANAEVRTAAQYERDQGKVWSKVSEVNKALKKSSASDSLLASLDDGEIAKERAVLARRVLAQLDAVSPTGSVVGFGYAIGNKVKGVRWFINNQVFSSFREVMANTAAIDAITARARGDAAPSSRPKPTAVARFVRNVQNATKREIRKTKAANVNEYLESDEAYGSSVILAPPGASPSAPKVKMSSDFMAN